LPILNRFFISVPPTLQRPHKSIPEKVKPFGWLAQCLLFHLKQLITAEDSVVPALFYKYFRSFNTSCPVSKRFTFAMGLVLYLRRSQKSSLDYQELKNLEANYG
jgi:hypothetical protein